LIYPIKHKKSIVESSNTGSIEEDDERVKGIILSYLYEKRLEGRQTIDQIKSRVAAMNPQYVEKDFRDLFLDNYWVDFSNSEGGSIITPSWIKEVERRSQEGSIT